MNVIILGAAGFIGTNLVKKLAEEAENEITLVDVNEDFFADIKKMSLHNVNIAISKLDETTDYASLLLGQDVVYHLVSTTVPTTSNQHVSQELVKNVVMTSVMLDACVECGVKKVIFISSGGTVYGKEANCPLKEDTATNPITSYGIQKVTIEKLLYLYNHMHGLDYRVIRLANPYGPYQRPNGILGAVTTFTYRALVNDKITVYGDGTVVRDFIYIDDAIRAIDNIVNKPGTHRTYNLGCGYGTSINEVLNSVQSTLDCKLDIDYKEARQVDVPVNYLDISRYEEDYGELKPISLEEGIRKIADFMKKYYRV